MFYSRIGAALAIALMGAAPSALAQTAAADLQKAEEQTRVKEAADAVAAAKTSAVEAQKSAATAKAAATAATKWAEDAKNASKAAAEASSAGAYFILSPLSTGIFIDCRSGHSESSLATQPLAVGYRWVPAEDKTAARTFGISTQAGGPGINYLGLTRSNRSQDFDCSRGNPVCTLVLGSVGLFVDGWLADTDPDREVTRGWYVGQLGLVNTIATEPTRSHISIGGMLSLGYVPKF